MTVKFNADEIFEIAEQIERNGAAFYRKAAEKADNDRMRDILDKLAKMEVEHEQAFQKLRAESVKEEWKHVLFDEDGQATLYLQALAGGNVFNLKVDPVKALEGCSNTEQVLRVAIGLEKESVVFYTGMQQMVPEKLGRDLINGIIQEEMGHIAIMARLIEELK